MTFNKLVLVSSLLVASLAPAAIGPAAQEGPEAAPQLPPAREIPGLTTEDRFPRACVDCHVDYVDMNLDTRLSTVMGRWAGGVEPEIVEAARNLAEDGTSLTGVHPAVDPTRTDVPAVCLGCHRSPLNPVPLVPLLHQLHFADDSVFLRVFQGECTHCHKLDRNTGTWQVPSSTEP